MLQSSENQQNTVTVDGIERNISPPRLTFLNHAGFRLEHEEVVMLCDPWFGGGVFNRSWSLVDQREPRANLQRNITHIWISHEHPDHLHFPTLRKLKEINDQPITLMYRFQKNKNVINAVAKLGFSVVELQDGKPLNVSGNVVATSYHQGSDSALLIRCGSRTILNQNDCLLSRATCRKILSDAGRIHVLMQQFSLAGYYGNEDDHGQLCRAHKRHLERFTQYNKIFDPEIVVPFASFIYFCKEGNSYLNRFRVRPSEVLRLVGDRAQLLCPEDMLLWDGWLGRNAHNIKRWEHIWDKDLIVTKDKAISRCDLEAAMRDFVNSMRQIKPAFLRPGTTTIGLRQSKRIVTVNLRRGTFAVNNMENDLVPDVVIGDSEILPLLQSPWGADTINITANLIVYRPIRWWRFSLFKHSCYVFSDRLGVVIGLAGLAATAMRLLRQILARDRN